MNQNNDVLGCSVILVFVVAIVAGISMLGQKSSCYDVHTKYGYETRYSIVNGCEMGIEDKWISVEGDKIAIDGIKEYLP